jgi:hypothetical protein
MNSDIDKFVNLIIDLIDLNENILSVINYDNLMDKRAAILNLYDEYESKVDKNKLSDIEVDSLKLLNSYLQHSNTKVIKFLQVRIINLRIKKRILEDRKKNLDSH